MVLSTEQAAELGAGLAAGLVYIVSKLRTRRETVTASVQFDRQWVNRMEAHAKRSHDLANEIQEIAFKVRTMAKRFDDHEKDYEHHKEVAAESMQRLVAVEEQSKYTKEQLGQIRTSIDNLQRSTEKSLRRTLRLLHLILGEERAAQVSPDADDGSEDGEGI